MTNPILSGNKKTVENGNELVGGSVIPDREKSSQTMGKTSGIAATPKPPYFAVVFTSERTETDAGYEEMATRMVELAARQPGFLGVESTEDDELEITVSYWSSLKAIACWKRHAEHCEAQIKGRDQWYRRYRVRITRVEREYSFGEETEKGLTGD